MITKSAFFQVSINGNKILFFVESHNCPQSEANKLLLYGFREFMKQTNKIEVKYFQYGNEMPEEEIKPTRSELIIIKKS